MAILKIGGKTFATHNEQTDTISLANDVVLPSIPVPTGHVVQTHFRSFDGVQWIGNGSNTGDIFTTIGLGVAEKEFSISMSVKSGNAVYGSGIVNMSSYNHTSSAEVTRYSGLIIYADSNKISVGASDGLKTPITSAPSIEGHVNEQYILNTAPFSFTFTPSSTDAIVYSVRAANFYNSAYITKINAPGTEANAIYTARGYSHFILMEIQQ